MRELLEGLVCWNVVEEDNQEKIEAEMKRGSGGGVPISPLEGRF